jgi:hypothetical protein
LNLNEQVDTINSREEFVSFVRTLLHDFKQDPGSWENDRLELFLNAVAGWVEDLDGYYSNLGEPVPDQPSWKVLGQILLAAKVYE